MIPGYGAEHDAKNEAAAEERAEQEQHGPCWICGKPGINRTRVEIGRRCGPFGRKEVPTRFSPWIDFCESSHCLLEFADFAEAVAKDFRRVYKNRQQRESRRASRG